MRLRGVDVKEETEEVEEGEKWRGKGMRLEGGKREMKTHPCDIACIICSHHFVGKFLLHNNTLLHNLRLNTVS
jgi:hypothetical protein